ncbi:MAG: hypothetical protein COX07_04755 [Bacteroidetes bacterium CG23_combo_of_CG06-09_8_20_14_all_32_9]|nr:MAG: hypothetical protein COX07_04755 [Bacteroidetes bacterium CG23_combo_of_CG06-09_8_20_14_all_32_9]
MAVETLNNLSFLTLLKKFEPAIFLYNTILYYEGEVNHEITKALTFTTEKHLGKTNAKHIIQKKIFNVMVECLQNIDKYAVEFAISENNLTRKGAILVSENKDAYYIVAGNIVNQKQIEILTVVINNLKLRKKEDLRFLYKKQLKNGMLSIKGGAGLGFIDIARKTGNPLQFCFYPLNSDLSFFVLKICITK